MLCMDRCFSNIPSKSKHLPLGFCLFCILTFIGLPPSFAVDATTPNDELQSWINQNAVSIRSIDPMDDDFKDLEFLINVIGNAQLVQLGEASHSVGNGFSAKSRLVKFLHQRMGFDVLVWEEGIYDMRLALAGLRGPEDAVTVAQRGIRLGWSNSAEVKPLLEYIKTSQSSFHPLEIAGYDTRYAPEAFEHFASRLRWFVAALTDLPVRQRAQALVENALAAYYRVKAAQPAGQQNDLDTLHHSADQLLEELNIDRELLERVHGSLETGFMERAIESMRSDGTGKFYLAQMKPENAANGTLFSKFWHQRDEIGARNFRWLIEKAYPGRKIIFWAHNVHVMDAYCGPLFKTISPETQSDGMAPVGTYLGDWLGKKAYTIVLAHFEGQEGLNGKNTDIPPAPSSSLEARFHVLGRPYLFLNLRTVAASRSHPLYQPQSLRVMIPTNYIISDITRAFDGILYIDHATPVVPVK